MANKNRIKGTKSKTYAVNADGILGKIEVSVVEGAADSKLTLTNAALTADRTITFPDATGTVALTSGDHTQNTDTGTTGNTFTIDSDSTTGKIVIDVALGSANKTLTVTNAALTDNRTITFPDATGTVMLVPTPQTELTDELATITFTAPSSADYALQDLTDTGGFGFKTKDEGNSVLAVIANLQTRVNELETKLVALGLLADAD